MPKKTKEENLVIEKKETKKETKKNTKKQVTIEEVEKAMDNVEVTINPQVEEKEPQNLSDVEEVVDKIEKVDKMVNDFSENFEKLKNKEEVEKFLEKEIKKTEEIKEDVEKITKKRVYPSITSWNGINCEW